MATPKIARIYIRVSTKDQNLDRQRDLEATAKAAGYYVAGVYEEKESGAKIDRAELQRMIKDLQPGDVVIAEKMDRLTRLPLDEATQLIETIKRKGARLAIPGVVDLSEIAANSEGAAKIVLEAVQELLLKLALQMARDDYETRKQRQREGIAKAQSDIASGKRTDRLFGKRADTEKHAAIIKFRNAGHSLSEIVTLSKASMATVCRVLKQNGIKKPD